MTIDSRHYYFVDEAGDLTFFDKAGRIIIGEEGVSKVFMVGIAQIDDTVRVEQTLEDLRSSLLKDPYFAGVPSMQKGAKKTALFFHAKDDVAEVRREVFKVLPTLGVKIQVAIRRKLSLAKASQLMFEQTGKKLKPDEIYDDLVKRLFTNLLHRASENRIFFASRGKASREAALKRAINRAQLNFQKKWRVNSNNTVKIWSATPTEYTGLQVVDYYLWALQRLIERKEDRFFNILAQDYRLIMDLDDRRNKDYGEWYSKSNPLTLQKIMPLEG